MRTPTNITMVASAGLLLPALFACFPNDKIKNKPARRQRRAVTRLRRTCTPMQFGSRSVARKSERDRSKDLGSR